MNFLTEFVENCEPVRRVELLPNSGLTSGSTLKDKITNVTSFKQFSRASDIVYILILGLLAILTILLLFISFYKKNSPDIF